MNKTYLLTGGSGFLGSLLSAELIKKGDKVIFLGRSKDGQTFKERISDILKKTGPEINTDNITALEIDLQKKFLGLDEPAIENLAGRIDGFWHLAANLSFKGKDSNAVAATNVSGLENILELVQRIKCPIYYVSTAYVCGRQCGTASENTTEEPAVFNNAYEKSKFAAEKLLRETAGKNEYDYIIFRPSILITTDMKQLSFFGYYNVVHSLHHWSQKLKKLKIKPVFIFPYHKKSLLNLMPVETAVSWMIDIAANPDSVNRTYHITNPRPFAIAAVARQTFESLGVKLVMFSAPRFFINLYLYFFYLVSFILLPSKKIAKKFFYYKNYIMQETAFDMKNTLDIIGKEKVGRLRFSENFIKDTAGLFIKNIDK